MELAWLVVSSVSVIKSASGREAQEPKSLAWQTLEMSVWTNNPSAMFRSQVRASYSKQSSPQTARHGDLQQRERNL